MTERVPTSLRPFYADWAGYNRRTIEGLRTLSDDDLALLVLSVRDGGGEPWPVWAVAGHTAAMRVFWLCESTWAIVAGCLDRWTPAMLGDEIRRDEAGRPSEVHTRQSILLRLLSHEAYHLGEINLALGSNGREPINPWPGREWKLGAPAWFREGEHPPR